MLFIFNVSAYLHVHSVSCGDIAMFYMVCGSFAHCHNVHMYTVLSLRVLLRITSIQCINHGVYICYVSAALRLICRCIEGVVAKYRYM
jgi:hypothetical protein